MEDPADNRNGATVLGSCPQRQSKVGPSTSRNDDLPASRDALCELVVDVIDVRLAAVSRPVGWLPMGRPWMAGHGQVPLRATRATTQPPTGARTDEHEPAAEADIHSLYASSMREGSIDVVRNPAGRRGLSVLPHRWVVQRTFLGREETRDNLTRRLASGRLSPRWA